MNKNENKHMLYVVGIGPGSKQNMTLEALEAMEKSDLIVGYTKYIELVKPIFPHKTFMQTGMKSETERCQMAIDECVKGQTVSMVCSGDSTVYGMASLIYELADKPDSPLPVDRIKSISGVTAALSGGALLGSPLTNDFVVISLSDLLTPIELIKKRVEAAASGDFCMAIYNPMSKTRNHLPMAVQILLQYKPADTVCGTARNIGREGETFTLTTLGELEHAQLDMFTTVFIGNSQTKNIGGYMVTKRGYHV